MSGRFITLEGGEGVGKSSNLEFIRRHLEAVGHPVAGDRRYGDFAFNRLARQRWGLRRMALHAWRLELPHPRSGERVALEAPLPPDLALFWAGCGKA